MYSIYRIFHPEVFQGSLEKKNYFEGWYFKHVSADTTSAIAVIPGISVSGDAHSFIQFIDGNSGKTLYVRYKPDDFVFSRKKFEIRVGKSFFSTDKIILDFANGDFSVSGQIENTDISGLPRSILVPGIMGWYSFIPWMECNHGVVSAGHKLTGSLKVNGQIIDFTGGNGYIEKDWGISFPESWIWLQCNNFSRERISIMISIAKIPWRGSYFMGFISFVSIDGHTEIFATYNRAKVDSLRRIDENNTEIIIKKGLITISAIITKRGAGTLKSPSFGLMDSVIKESLNSEVFLELRDAGKLVFSGTGTRAGYEETEKIFTYFQSPGSSPY